MAIRPLLLPTIQSSGANAFVNPQSSSSQTLPKQAAGNFSDTLMRLTAINGSSVAGLRESNDSNIMQSMAEEIGDEDEEANQGLAEMLIGRHLRVCRIGCEVSLKLTAESN